MQSDWHRYNLKRRVASLPPLSSEVFAEKVISSQADAAATAARALWEKFCEPCQKNYYSENAYTNHLGSKKHKINAENLSASGRSKRDDETQSIMSSTFSLANATPRAKSPVAPIDSDAEDEFSKIVDGMHQSTLDDEGEKVTRRPTRPHHSAAEEKPEHPLSPPVIVDTKSSGEIPREHALRQCLFCSNFAVDLTENMQHMRKIHSLFVPESNYLVDLEGLITYLNGKVYDDYQCLYCNRLKWSEDGIRTHMRDMSHCKIAYETEDAQLEIGQFYDFRSTYSDSEDDDDEGEEGENEDGWETSSDVSSVATNDIGPVYVDADKSELKGKLQRNRHHSRSSQTSHKSADGFHSRSRAGSSAIYHDEFELHLPTGRVAGHRAHNKYYKQNLRNYPTPAERADRLLTQGEDDDSGRGRARGRDEGRVGRGAGMLLLSDSKKKEVSTLEKKSQVKDARRAIRGQLRVNRANNKQKHYREQIL
jgi:pre-60S factor REI1